MTHPIPVLPSPRRRDPQARLREGGLSAAPETVGPAYEPVGAALVPVGAALVPVGAAHAPVGAALMPVGAAHEAVGPAPAPVGWPTGSDAQPTVPSAAPPPSGAPPTGRDAPPTPLGAAPTGLDAAPTTSDAAPTGRGAGRRSPSWAIAPLLLAACTPEPEPPPVDPDITGVHCGLQSICGRALTTGETIDLVATGHDPARRWFDLRVALMPIDALPAEPGDWEGTPSTQVLDDIPAVRFDVPSTPGRYALGVSWTVEDSGWDSDVGACDIREIPVIEEVGASPCFLLPPPAGWDATKLQWFDALPSDSADPAHAGDAP